MSTYAFATIFESIEFPAGKASANTFIAAKGYVIEKDELGWLHIKWPPTGEHVEFSPSQVKQMRHVPIPPAPPKEKKSP